MDFNILTWTLMVITIMAFSTLLPSPHLCPVKTCFVSKIYLCFGSEAPSKKSESRTWNSLVKETFWFFSALTFSPCTEHIYKTCSCIQNSKESKPVCLKLICGRHERQVLGAVTYEAGVSSANFPVTEMNGCSTMLNITLIYRGGQNFIHILRKEKTGNWKMLSM